MVTGDCDPVSAPRCLGAILVRARDRGLVFKLLDKGAVCLNALVRELYSSTRSAIDHGKWALGDLSYNFREVKDALQSLER